MPDIDKENEKLDNEYSQLLLQLQECIFILNYREKYLITEWLNKLKQSKSSVDERKLRNRFMKHFVSNLNASVNVFRNDPFNKLPKNFSGPLTDLSMLLPKNSYERCSPTEDEKQSYIADLFQNLVDKGEFLGEQPVPKKGTFVILIARAQDDACNCSKM